jgi:hypothetical protein
MAATEFVFSVLVIFPSLQGSDGACIVKTNQCVLVGMYGENLPRHILTLSYLYLRDVKKTDCCVELNLSSKVLMQASRCIESFPLARVSFFKFLTCLIRFLPA